MKVYICPITEIVDINISDSLLDDIGIHHTMGLEEDATNATYFNEEDVDYEDNDPFFIE
jgi:hypothetical protein